MGLLELKKAQGRQSLGTHSRAFHIFQYRRCLSAMVAPLRGGFHALVDAAVVRVCAETVAKSIVANAIKPNAMAAILHGRHDAVIKMSILLRRKNLRRISYE